MLLLSSVAWSAARAESWPAPEDLVPRCVLIVHCRTESFEGRVLYKVLEVLKGDYSPPAFAKQPPTGYIDTSISAGGGRAAGQEVILFYTGNSLAGGDGISRHDMEIPVRDGKVVYPPRGEEVTLSEPATVAEFTKRIKELAGEPREDGALRRLGEERPRRIGRAQARAATPPRDLGGEWRLLLPAGFESAVTLTRVEDAEGERYRLTPGNNLSGVYEAHDGRLVLVGADNARYEGADWKVVSPYLISLASHPATEADYAGAVLFRSNGLELVREGVAPVRED